MVVTTSLNRHVAELGVKFPVAIVHRRFGELVQAAGGVPIYSNEHADPHALAQRVDAVVINGGGDVGPERYGAEPHERTCEVEPERDEFEIELVRAAVRRAVPVLGICRGIQLVNVALGGTLVQHVPEAVGQDHLLHEGWDRPVHDVLLEPESRLAALYKRPCLKVNSLHHQAVERPAPGLRVSARAPDGTIEGIESEDGMVLGVQWHPELLAMPAGDEHAVLFEWLARARTRA